MLGLFLTVFASACSPSAEPEPVGESNAALEDDGVGSCRARARAEGSSFDHVQCCEDKLNRAREDGRCHPNGVYDRACGEFFVAKFLACSCRANPEIVDLPVEHVEWFCGPRPVRPASSTAEDPKRTPRSP